MAYPRAIVPALVALVAGLSSCGESPSSSSSAPRPERDTSPTIVRVGDGRVTRAELDRWLAVFAAAKPLGAGRSAELEARTMEFLIQAEWVEQEARRLGVEVTEDEARRRFEREIADTFPDERELRRFLAQSGRTMEDAIFQLRLTMLQSALMRKAKERIQVSETDVARYYRRNRGDFDGPLTAVEENVRRVVRAKREERLLSRFTGRITKAQRDRTWCAKGFVVPQCGNSRAGG